MKADTIDETLSPLIEEMGFFQVTGGRWKQWLNGEVFAGLLVSEIKYVPAGMRKAEVIFSLSVAAIDEFRNWKGPGSWKLRYAHPSFSKKLTDTFPEGKLWEPEISPAVNRESMFRTFEKLMVGRILPFAETHQTPEKVKSLVLGIGGVVAFEYCYAEIALGSGVVSARKSARKIALQCGVSLARMDAFLQERESMKDSDLDEIRARVEKLRERPGIRKRR